MRAFAKNQKIFSWLSVYPMADGTRWWIRMLKHTFSIFAGIVLLFALIFNACFVLKYANSDLGSALHALYQVASETSALYTLVAAFITRQKIIDVFDKYQKIFNLNQAKDKNGHFERANTKNERIIGYTLKYLIPLIIFSLLEMATISLIYSRFAKGFIDVKILFIPYKFVVPWNQETFEGWCGVVFYSMITGFCYLVVNYGFLTFFLSIGEFHSAFTNFYCDSIGNMDNEFRQNPRNTVKVKSMLCALIRFQIAAKEIFISTADLYSNFLFVELTCAMVFMACSTFEIDLCIQKPDIKVGLFMMAIAVSASNLFLYCFYGRSATDNFIKYPDYLYESNWMDLPNELQKFFILMIANTERPLFYHGFYVVRLNLETFSSMLKTVISYYLMFKTLATK